MARKRNSLGSTSRSYFEYSPNHPSESTMEEQKSNVEEHRSCPTKGAVDDYERECEEEERKKDKASERFQCCGII